MPLSGTTLAAAITKAASKQTYYTIRFLADRQRVDDAYCAYAYFRWVDDTLDASTITKPERQSFIARQQLLLERCYRGEMLSELSPEEQILDQLVRDDAVHDSSLQIYLRNMMAVMAFDASRRGRIISQAELERYTHNLASAVTEAMHYFIGQRCYSPHDETRYLAVTAAHITHMLRDMADDIDAGYYNIPAEVLAALRIEPQTLKATLGSDAGVRRWVQSRVQLARAYFKAGRIYLSQLGSWRCKLAGFAYAARFEGLLDTIEQEDYRLRSSYNERKNLRSRLQMSWDLLLSLANQYEVRAAPRVVSGQPRSLENL